MRFRLPARRRARLALVSALATVAAGLASLGWMADASACVDGTECPSGFCADSVCCDSVCDGPCVSCSFLFNGGVDGECGPIAADSDPKDGCVNQGDVSCGTQGMCDGAGACAFYPAGTACPHCRSMPFGFVPVAECDGSGTCVDMGDVEPCVLGDPCRISSCGSDGCETTSKPDGIDCGGGEVCLHGECGTTATTGSSGAGGAGGSGDGGSAQPPVAADEGCGCRTAPGPLDPARASLLALAIVALAGRRRAQTPASREKRPRRSTSTST